MSHAFPKPVDTPRFPAQYLPSDDSDDWQDSDYQYTAAEIRAINGHYGWEKFRLTPHQSTKA